MLSKRKVGVILVTAVMVGCAVVAPVAAAKKDKKHYSIQSKGVEAGYYGSTLENRAYVNMKNGDYNYYYEIALQDKKSELRGWKNGTVKEKNTSKKLTSCWVDRSYGTNGAGAFFSYEY